MRINGVATELITRAADRVSLGRGCVGGVAGRVFEGGRGCVGEARWVQPNSQGSSRSEEKDRW